MPGAGEILYRGQCYCGAVALRFYTRKPAADLALRACQCGFCRKHGARTTADPEGRAEIVVRDADAVERYRFALGTADYFVCRRCGVYLGAVMTEAGRGWSVLNVNAFDDAAAFARPPAPMVYDHEDEAGRRARRRKLWTPTTVVAV